jgi:hypothetical protein
MIDHTPPAARAKAKAAEHKRFFAQVKKQDHRLVDDTVHALHEEVFEETDCLQCGNCCRTTSPLFIDADIDRLARHLRMSPGDFTRTYLRVDEDGDYVFKAPPCPFLGHDNYCSVYEARPRACREYPHTDRKRFQQVLDLTLKNAAICPAVFEIIERWRQL